MALVEVLSGSLANYSSRTNKIASIDIGWKNFAIYTKTMVDGSLAETKMLYTSIGGPTNYTGLADVLSRWVTENMDVTGIIIEKQLDRNVYAIRMVHYVVGYLSAIRWPGPKMPFILFLDSRLKTLSINPYMFAYKNMKAATKVVADTLVCRGVCISRTSDHVKFFNDLVTSKGKAKVPHEVKSDTIPRALAILEKVGETIVRSKIIAAKKKDDMADTVCQLDAFELYMQIINAGA